MRRSLVVGVAGGTGSGKTTFSRALQRRLANDVEVIPHDNYYRAHHDLSYEQRSELNYDHPDAYETELLVSDLAHLRQGHVIQMPTYDFSIHDRVSATVPVRPAPVIIVEGILVFHSSALRELMDVRIFVDAEADVRILRRALRDVSERGRSLQSVLDQYFATVKPMHETFVEPTKRFADIVVPGSGDNTLAADMVAGWIRGLLDNGGES